MGEEAKGKRMAVEAMVQKMAGEEAEAFGRTMGEVAGVYEWILEAVVGTSERMGEEGEACERMRGEEEGAFVTRSGVDGEAMWRKMSEEVVGEEGMMTVEVEEGQGKKR